MESNIDLCTRFGGGGTNPSRAEMVAALRELFVEDNPHCTEADYAEHPEASLSYGHDNPDLEEYVWTVFSIAVNRDGSAVFTKYRDQDDDEPEFEYRIDGLTLDTAVQLWETLANGKTDELLSQIRSA